MILDDIIKIMPPPREPSEISNVLNNHSWSTIEDNLGLKIPNDYKEFIQAYGSGSIDNFLTIFNPFSENTNINLVAQLYIQTKIYDDLKEYGEKIPYDFFPLENSIFPFGMTDNGDLLFWQISESLAEWNIIVNEARSSNWEVFQMSMTDFLLRILQKKIVCHFFPSTFPDINPIFEKY